MRAQLPDTEKPKQPSRSRHSPQRQQNSLEASHAAPPTRDLEAQLSSDSMTIVPPTTDETRPRVAPGVEVRLGGGLSARHDRQEPVSVASVSTPLEPRQLPDAPTTDVPLSNSPDRPPDIPAQPQPTHLPYTGAPPTYEEILRS